MNGDNNRIMQPGQVNVVFRHQPGETSLAAFPVNVVIPTPGQINVLSNGGLTIREQVALSIMPTLSIGEEGFRESAAKAHHLARVFLEESPDRQNQNELSV